MYFETYGYAHILGGLYGQALVKRRSKVTTRLEGKAPWAGMTQRQEPVGHA